MLAIPKKDGEIRICLDPKDLNSALRPVFVAPKYPQSLMQQTDFGTLKLDEDSSYLTTFYTPFERYSWCKMPFGTRLAPEVFQRPMRELIEGLSVTGCR